MRQEEKKKLNHLSQRASPTINRRSRLRRKNVEFFLKCLISQTMICKTLGGGGWVGETRHYSFSLSKLSGNKCCLWFKAQANRRGDGTLCLSSAAQFGKGKVTRVKGCLKCYQFAALRQIQMFILSLSIWTTSLYEPNNIFIINTVWLLGLNNAKDQNECKQPWRYHSFHTHFGLENTTKTLGWQLFALLPSLWQQGRQSTQQCQ